MILRAVPFVALSAVALVAGGCGVSTTPDPADAIDDPGVDPTPPDDDPQPDPDPDPDDTDVPPAGNYLDIGAGYLASGFGWDAATQTVVEVAYPGGGAPPIEPFWGVILFDIAWTFDFADPRYCYVGYSMTDAAVAAWAAGIPGIVLGLDYVETQPGYTDCYDDAFHPSIDPAVWPDSVGSMTYTFGVGIGERTGAVTDAFVASAPTVDWDAEGLVGGVMQLPDGFDLGPTYRDVYGFAYAIDDDHTLIQVGASFRTHRYADVVGSSAGLPSGYSDLSSLDAWEIVP